MNALKIKSYFARRKLIRQARHLLKIARHVYNLRQDAAAPEDLRRLLELEGKLTGLLATADRPAIEKTGAQLAAIIERVCPPRPHSILRENIEVLVVALAVAMAFRTYFVQPFKIPTSSMYPTLAGIHYIEKEKRACADFFPLNIFKVALFGMKYVEIRSQASGVVDVDPGRDGTVVRVGNIEHKIFPNMFLHVARNSAVCRGQLLASGVKIAGDHIFVNKVKWNFIRPARGEIMVFKTDGIRHPQIKPNEHYVKRLVGLPGEVVGIVTPSLYINEKNVQGVAMLDKIQSCRNGYNGYIQAGDYMAGGLAAVNLKNDEYFACGDNQRNSLDSRYWGPVKSRNMVGPAFFVYWPLSRNWGPVR